jgi:soluble lytic murein transglycosylase
MQLMPDLAETLHADRFPGAPYDPDQLYRPAYNALLGTTELGKLHARFNGDSRLSGSGGAHGWIPLVIAGYNGGPEAVNRWLNISRVAIEPDIFMENIGYTETRRYVRKVLGYMQTYRYVYGDGE